MHDDISRMTAKEAAEEASLMHGKVYTPLHLRLLYIGELLLFWLALFLLMRWLHHHSVILMVCFAGIVLFLAVIAFLVTVKSFSDSIIYDGFDGEITCRSPFHRKQVYRFEQLQFVERLGVQRREDDIHCGCISPFCGVRRFREPFEIMRAQIWAWWDLTAGSGSVSGAGIRRRMHRLL